MRRRSIGVLSVDQLFALRQRRVDGCPSSAVIEALERYVGDDRKALLQNVLAARLGSISVLFDQPYDPHNGAAVMRSAEAFGIQHLHVIERAGAPFLAANSVTRGASKWIDLHCHGSLSEAVSAVRRTGQTLVAAVADGELEPEALTQLDRVCIVLGNEREGIRPELLARCDRTVRVPMRGFVESLNVSVTGAILMHAATRGRTGDLSAEDRARVYARGLYFSLRSADKILDVLGLGPSVSRVPAQREG
jgi:tRNA (guanosine-2'-O-)-methyltransferase